MNNQSIGYHSFSIGYHTLTVVAGIYYYEANEIRKAFQRCSQLYDHIVFYPYGKTIKVELPDGTYDDLYPHYRAFYYVGEQWVIRWIVRYCNYDKDKNFFYIEATINPKILLGENDFITATDQSYLLGICEKYNSIIKDISDIIPEFKRYIPNRVDYCFNCDITHVAFGCTGKQMMKLIKRSDIPKHYNEYEAKYDKKTHRREDITYSHYLINDSVNINCYWKSREQKKRFKNRKTPSENIIRFEVQCKYSKMYTLRQRISKDVPDTELCNFLITSRLLADDLSKQELKKYFNRIIKSGNYYRLKDAIKLINDNKNLYAANKAKLITVLNLVDELETIPNARKHFIRQGLSDANVWGSMLKANNKYEEADLRDEFNSILRKLAKLQINPVTIPERWRIPFIPGIMTVHDF